ncbi:MAG TPA: 1,6-anhydro-N-acetylmuramyl-L-alanine amidase AmpD [Gammaproteobacteria bacterium]|nr:1,6-anhydro-N-acetylmuramyl-L-alanine amidase AmpD [Gammaproteobacteria bacterium]
MTKFFIDDAGWLISAESLPSPNFDSRPDDARIKLIVVHGISLPPGEYGGGHIRKFFCNRLDVGIHPYFESICELQVSAHCLIERGGNIVQFVSFLDRAWHAGVSEWRGEPACNDYSVGIELEGCDDQAYESEQYASLARLVEALRASYPDIDADALAGHSDIAPGRKTDPGTAFDWAWLEQLLAERLAANPADGDPGVSG